MDFELQYIDELCGVNLQNKRGE